MPEPSKIVMPYGGYKSLIVYRKSNVIYEGTVLFCRRFFPPYGDRTVDQMIQAARSCKQNIVEGSGTARASMESEIKLTGVARASLDELMEDYTDWLTSHNAVIWNIHDQMTQNAREFAIKHLEWEDWKPIFMTRPPEELANLMLTLCHQTRYMLDKLMTSQQMDFTKNGGIRERMHAARTEYRSKEWNKGLYSKLDRASTPEELGAYIVEIQDAISKTIYNVMKKKGWGCV